MLDQLDVQSQQTHEADHKSATAWKAGACLLGAGVGGALMFVFDPARGKRRRAILRDKSASLLNKGSKQMEITADRFSDRLSGLAATARHMVDLRRPDDEVLVARVRSQLGHLIDQPHDVDVLADKGVVVLRGKVGTGEAEVLVQGVGAIDGVKHVESQLLGAALVKPASVSLGLVLTGFGLAIGLVKLLRNA